MLTTAVFPSLDESLVYIFPTLHAFESSNGQRSSYQGQEDFYLFFLTSLEGEGEKYLPFGLVKSITFPYSFGWHKEGWDHLLSFPCCTSSAIPVRQSSSWRGRGGTGQSSEVLGCLGSMEQCPEWTHSASTAG